MILIAIDPGKTGSITIKIPYVRTSTSNPNIGTDSLTIYPMPATEQDIMGLLAATRSPWQDRKAIIEAQHAFPGMSAKGQWSFAQHYGFIRGCLVSLGIPFIEVSPQKWMAYFGFKRLKDEDKKKHKQRILQKAQNLFPQSSVALQTADSLMLAEYLRLTDRS